MGNALAVHFQGLVPFRPLSLHLGLFSLINQGFLKRQL
jgi:hypothetical protein